MIDLGILFWYMHLEYPLHRFNVILSNQPYFSCNWIHIKLRPTCTWSRNQTAESQCLYICKWILHVFLPQAERYKELKELAWKQGAVCTQQAEKLHWEVRADREKMAFDQRRKKEVEVLSELMLHIFEVKSNMFHTEITIILTMYENIYISVFKFLYTVHI